jgi:site-specific DNA-cytosine methylase
MTVIDLYAGAGGWGHAAQQLGLDPIGIELDADTCTTSAAAGLRTIRADILNAPIRPTPLAGLIASPPCPAFSAAGDGHGREELPALCAWLDVDEAPLFPCEAAESVDGLMLASPVEWIDQCRLYA